MVDVVRWTPQHIRSWADDWLPRLSASWSELPAVMAEIDSWNDDDAMDFIEEWRHYESQRFSIERAAELDVLTSEQMAQLDRLRQLVARHRALRDHLLGV